MFRAIYYIKFSPTVGLKVGDFEYMERHKAHVYKKLEFTDARAFNEAAEKAIPLGNYGLQPLPRVIVEEEEKPEARSPNDEGGKDREKPETQNPKSEGQKTEEGIGKEKAARGPGRPPRLVRKDPVEEETTVSIGEAARVAIAGAERKARMTEGEKTKG